MNDTRLTKTLELVPDEGFLTGVNQPTNPDPAKRAKGLIAALFNKQVDEFTYRGLLVRRGTGCLVIEDDRAGNPTVVDVQAVTGGERVVEVFEWLSTTVTQYKADIDSDTDTDTEATA